MRVNIDHQNVYFIGDTHFFHSFMLSEKADNRPFDTIEQMHETMISKWNEKVPKDGIVFHLGDLSWKSNNQTKEILERLNGRIYYILGNHDRIKDIIGYKRWEGIYDKVDLYIKDDTAIDKIGKIQHLVLDHYPQLSWNRIHYGSIHLHGHVHMHFQNNPAYIWYYEKLVMDVGCNNPILDYAPISYSEVKDIMAKKLDSGKGHTKILK